MGFNSGFKGLRGFHCTSFNSCLPLLTQCLSKKFFLVSYVVKAAAWSPSKEDFQRCFQQWQYYWSKCVCAEEQYFENDRVRFSRISFCESYAWVAGTFLHVLYTY